MNHTEHLTRYTANFIDELVCSGLNHVVISPGSRSTPLAMLCREHSGIKDWVLVDERSAAYFALGLAKKLQKPVALVCTSGTAAANYFPAVVEAYHGRVPLIVLTADRPHELRGIGAPQTIDQINLYGNFVKDFLEMALPEATDAMIRYARNRAARTVRIAMQESQGPVQVNFPFREPLVPDFDLPNLWGDSKDVAFNLNRQGKKQLPNGELQLLANILSKSEKGLIVCGPQIDLTLAESIVSLSNALEIPILADPMSQLRSGKHEKENIISTYDTIFRAKELRTELKPDYIIRFGAMPISKSYLFYIQEHAKCKQIVVEHNEMVRDPSNQNSELIFADGRCLIEGLIPYLTKKGTSSWLKKWQSYEKITTEILTKASSTELTEGETARTICEVIPENSDLFVSNSMPVRDLDTFFKVTDKMFTTHGNRGASGIDGVTSTALGIAAAANKKATLMIGDLSFYHDLNGLLAAKIYQLDITIILINNNGGGIFSFLPQAKEGRHFEALFGTPIDLDFEKAVTMYEGSFMRVSTLRDLKNSLQNSYSQKGLSVIEVCTDREKNAFWHQKIWNQVKKRLMDHDK